MRRENISLERWSNVTGFPVATVRGFSEDLGAKSAGRTTAFILGSGSSILNLSQKQLEIVGKSFSVGFGAFALHTFVPDAYAFAPVGDLRDYGRVYSEVMSREDIVSKKPRVLVLRPRNKDDVAFITNLPAIHKKRAQLYGRVGAIGSNPRNLGSFFGTISQETNSDSAKLLISLDAGATVLRLISILALSGAEEIVLLGVDIVNSRYFWEEAPDFLSFNGFAQFDSGAAPSAIHRTQTNIGRQIPILQSVPALASYLRENCGTYISLGTQGSALSGLIPQFSWHHIASGCSLPEGE